MNTWIKALAITTTIVGLSACASSTSSNELDQYKETSVTTYQCGNDKVTAKFLSDEFNNIALVSVNNEAPALLSNSLAASGAKYQGSIYELWTKGDNATFRNLLKAPNRNIQCKTIN